MSNRRKTAEQRAMEAATEPSRDGSDGDNIITLSNGIRLRVQRVAPLAIREAVLRVEKPRPPMVMVEDKGREEENPQHPDYLRAMEEYEEATGLAAMNVLLLMGTAVESIPEGLSRPEDDDWVENLEFLEIEVDRDNPKARYLAWLRYSALTSDQDLAACVGIAREFAGVKEEDVASGIDSFRGRKARPANRKRPPRA